MSDIQRKHPNARMSQIVVHNGVVHLSGQVSPDLAAGSPPVEDQTRGVLARIDELLAEAGTNKSRLLTAQIWLADMAEFSKMNGVWESWIDSSNPPARTTIGVALAHPKARVEITVSAAI